MTHFIAEVSSNHNRDINRCFDFIDCAADIGCDSVKFQLFKTNQLFAPEILQKSKQHRDVEKGELPLEFLPQLADRCKERDIQFKKDIKKIIKSSTSY